jgi:hypothetical protein
MIYNLQHFQDYIQCPRYFYLNKENAKPNAFQRKFVKTDKEILVWDLIERIYTSTMLDNKIIEWSCIRREITKRFAGDLEANASKTENILSQFQHWWTEYNTTVSAVTHFVPRISIGDLWISDYLPVSILKADGSQVLLITLPIEKSVDFSKDFIVQATIWLAQQSIHPKINGLEIFLFGSGARFIKIKEGCSSKLMYNIYKGIQNEVIFPVFSSFCVSCPFQEDCKL